MVKTTKKQRAKKGKAVAKPYEPTEREKPILDAFTARSKASPPVDTMKVNEDKLQFSPDHSDLRTGTFLLMDAMGTTNLNFLNGIVSELINASTKGKDPDVEKLNYMLSIVTGIEPRDQMEAMLAAQMAAVHSQMMTFARRLNHTETIPQQDSAERAFNKLARTFTTQMEALNRYRGKGQQKMTVEHVNVASGGQAIIGNVQGGGDQKKAGEQPHAQAVTHAPGETLRSEDQERDGMPVPGNA